MTGRAEQSDMPLSRLTVASLRDLGYEVNMDAADPYSLTAAIIAPASPLRRGVVRPRYCCMALPE